MPGDGLRATSPGLHEREQSATNSVAVGLAGTSGFDPDSGTNSLHHRVINDAGSRDLIATEHALPLRYLDCEVGQYTVKGVVDSDATLVIISRQFWEELGKPIDITRRMPLATSAPTVSLCAKLEVKVAGILFHLQAHVVENAPFSLLLGRPFLSLANAYEQHCGDGTSFLTLHDPNSDRAIRIPTKLRTRRDAPAQGF